MVGIVDVGGGLRGNYTAGIYDYLLDNSIDIEYCLGVSAGSANLITYIAGQRGRLKRFYEQYSFEKEYLSLGNYFKKGMLLDLDYIYSDIINSTGKDPFDFGAAMKSDKQFVAVATDALTGKPQYFSKDDMDFDDYTLLKASSCLPIISNKPISFKGKDYFDGGISDPIPYKKALSDGCEKMIICLTLPIDFIKKPIPKIIVKSLVKKYPEIGEQIISANELYNNLIKEILELEKQGTALILYPKECFGINTITRDKEGLDKLYNLGYEDGKKIKAFLRKNDNISVSFK